MWTRPEHLPSKTILPDGGNRYFIIAGTGICFNEYPVKYADEASFVCHLDFAKDKSRCYRMGTIFSGADPATFEVLNSYFARDKNHIYNIGGVDRKVDYESFEVLDAGYETDPDGRRRNTTSYARDKNGLWMMEYYSYKPVMLKGIDPLSFERIDESFAKDKQFVLWRGKKIKKADPDTFVPLSSNFGRDARHIICQGGILADADYATFEVVPGHVALAKDKNRYYQFCWEINAEEFEDIVRDRSSAG